MGAHAVKLLKQGIGGVAVGIRNEKMVEKTQSLVKVAKEPLA